MAHVYFGAINLALTATQRNQLVTALRALGRNNNDPQPAYRNHWRTRLDNEAVIFEAEFDENTISIQAFKDRLAAIFGVSAATITHATSLQTFASKQTAVVTFSRSSTAYLRVALFGYDGTTWPSWAESRIECGAYLASNAAAWETAG
jgi:hypothetical protein